VSTNLSTRSRTCGGAPAAAAAPAHATAATSSMTAVRVALICGDGNGQGIDQGVHWCDEMVAARSFAMG